MQRQQPGPYILRSQRSLSEWRRRKEDSGSPRAGQNNAPLRGAQMAENVVHGTLALRLTHCQRGAKCNSFGQSNQNTTEALHSSGHRSKAQAFPYVWMPNVHPRQQATGKPNHSKMASKSTPGNIFGTLSESLKNYQSDLKSSYWAHIATIPRQT